MFDIFRFFKYGVVGFSGVIIDFGITWIARERFRVNKYIANSLGFTCAATSNYILNRIWTFANTDPNIARQFGLFFGISLVGLALNNAIVYFLHSVIKINFYAAKLVAIGFVTVFNYAANSLLTFAVR